jgi:hypothetical protein
LWNAIVCGCFRVRINFFNLVADAFGHFIRVIGAKSLYCFYTFAHFK